MSKDGTKFRNFSVVRVCDKYLHKILNAGFGNTTDHRYVHYVDYYYLKIAISKSVKMYIIVLATAILTILSNTRMKLRR